MIDKHGTLSGKYQGFVELVPGQIRINQTDIRAFQEAKAAVAQDSVEAKRVHFLWLGLENARLTAETAIAYDGHRKSGDYFDFAEKVKALDGFRAGTPSSTAMAGTASASTCPTSCRANPC